MSKLSFKSVLLYQNQNTHFIIICTQGDINKYTLYMYLYNSCKSCLFSQAHYSDFLFKQPACKQECRLTKTRETSDSLNSGHPNRSLTQKLLRNVSHDLGNGLYQE